MPSAEIREAEIKRQREREARRGKPNIREKLLAEHKANRSPGRALKRNRRWEELIDHIPVSVPTIGAEIGVWRGDTALRVLPKRPLTTHIMIDPWTTSMSEEYVSTGDRAVRLSQDEFDAMYSEVCEKAERFGERAVVMRMESSEAAEQIDEHSLDYVFIDAEHTYSGVKSDIEAWRGKVKHGGWLGGHDYDNLPRFPGVRRAVDEAFPNGVELGADHTWWIRLL